MRTRKQGFWTSIMFAQADAYRTMTRKTKAKAGSIHTIAARIAD